MDSSPIGALRSSQKGRRIKIKEAGARADEAAAGPGRSVESRRER